MSRYQARVMVKVQEKRERKRKEKGRGLVYYARVMVIVKRGKPQGRELGYARVMVQVSKGEVKTKQKERGTGLIPLSWDSNFGKKGRKV